MHEFSIANIGNVYDVTLPLSDEVPVTPVISGKSTSIQTHGLHPPDTHPIAIFLHLGLDSWTPPNLLSTQQLLWPIFLIFFMLFFAYTDYVMCQWV